MDRFRRILLNTLLLIILSISILSIAHSDIVIPPEEKNEFYANHVNDIDINYDGVGLIGTKNGFMKVYKSPEDSENYEIVKTPNFAGRIIYTYTYKTDTWVFVNEDMPYKYRWDPDFNPYITLLNGAKALDGKKCGYCGWVNINELDMNYLQKVSVKFILGILSLILSLVLIIVLIIMNKRADRKIVIQSRLKGRKPEDIEEEQYVDMRSLDFDTIDNLKDKNKRQ